MDTQNILILVYAGFGGLAVAGLVGCIALRGRARIIRQSNDALKQRYGALEQRYSTLEQRYRALEEQYSGVADAEAAVARTKRALDDMTGEHARQVEARGSELKMLDGECRQAKERYDSLRAEISLIEENLEDISFGVYKPHFDFQTSDEYKSSLINIRDRQKLKIRAGSATRCDVEWSVGGSFHPRQLRIAR